MSTDDGYAMVREEPVCCQNSELFQASKTFTGGKPGFVFKLGEHGQGYYLDLSDAELDDELSRCLRLDNQAAEAPAKLPLLRLALRGRFDIVSRALVTGPQLWHVTLENGATLLHVAAQKGEAEFLDNALRDGPLKVDAMGNCQKTPLMWAVALGQLGAIRVLLNARANPRFRCPSGCTPMMISVQHKQLTSILLLLASSTEDRVAMLDDLDNIGCNTVHWAAFMGDLDSLKVLGRSRANFMDVDKSRNTALHHALQAAQSDGQKLLEFLIEQGIDPSAENAYGRTCMDVAKDSDNPKVLETLEKVLGTTRSAELKKVDPVDLEVGSGKHARTRGEKAQSLQEWLGIYLPMLIFIGCVCFAVFEYMLDIRQTAWEHKYTWPAALAFEAGVCISICLFVYVATCDPGKVAPDQYHCGMEAIMRALRDGRDINAQRLCTTTWVLKGLRTKYCTTSKACVREFDHFCDFTACPIGEKNHRPFIVLACVEPATQAWHLLLCAVVVLLSSGVPPSAWEVHVWAFNVALRYPLIVMVVGMHLATGGFVIYLLAIQTLCISTNLTMNEMQNWTRYEHFWCDPSHPPKDLKADFRNPFTKGTLIHNLVDFWWWRRRDQVGPMCSQRVWELQAALKDAGAQ